MTQPTTVVEQERPRPAVGQVWRGGISGREFTITAAHRDGRFDVEYVGGEKHLRVAGDWIGNLFVRGPENHGGEESLGCSADKPPAPAVGQRWKNVGGVQTFVYELNEVRPHGNWVARYDDGGWTSLPADWFANGRLAFVSHGETRSGAATKERAPKESPSLPAPQGRAPEVPAPNSCCYGFNGVHASDCPDGQPLTAFTILQSRERARQAKREEDARAVAGFCDEWDLLPPADGRRWP